MKMTRRTIQEHNLDNNLRQRYEIYVSCADNGKGMDITTNCQRPLKTFDEWLEG
jgi:hypothetical protein